MRLVETRALLPTALRARAVEEAGTFCGYWACVGDDTMPYGFTLFEPLSTKLPTLFPFHLNNWSGEV